ncbi:RING finger protein 212B isoform X2 [Parus major]|uniref:RING finger protein 212B isoform X2 n=1 Tax=Parus major TaxID=9157 RepID=UPI0007715C74|nr:RING finger protein 212B isoform X2 [Parus major]
MGGPEIAGLGGSRTGVFKVAPVPRQIPPSRGPGGAFLPPPPSPIPSIKNGWNYTTRPEGYTVAWRNFGIRLSRVEISKAAPHPGPAMDWFHCARCFRQDGTQFTITSCGHILCEGCGGTGPCPVCATACRYLPLSQQMRPEVKVFFKNPVAIALKHLAHVMQVWQFQKAQAQLLVDLHRDKSQQMQAELEKAREELRETRRELESLRQENAELRRIQVTPKVLLSLPWPPKMPPKVPLPLPSPPDYPPQTSLPAKTALQISPQLSPGWRWSSRSSTPRPSPTQSVTPQPRRQLSSQVVSRLAPLEPPRSHSTPGWQAGVAYRDSRTPLASNVVPPRAGTSVEQGSALRPARGGRSQWDSNPRP